MQKEMKEEKPEGTELAEAHWKWLEGTLHKNYVDAMVHGIRHGGKIEMERCKKETGQGYRKINIVHVSEPDVEKPCKRLGYCPYGALVEEFPLIHNRQNKLACTLENGAIVQFGHNCPVHYLAELVDKKDLEQAQDLFPKPKNAGKITV